MALIAIAVARLKFSIRVNLVDTVALSLMVVTRPSGTRAVILPARLEKCMGRSRSCLHLSSKWKQISINKNSHRLRMTDRRYASNRKACNLASEIGISLDDRLTQSGAETLFTPPDWRRSLTQGTA